MVKNVIIIAAGKGTRLKPLTDDKPKCMVKVAGKPILRHIYDNIHKVIPNPIIQIVVNYRLDVIVDYVKKEKIDSYFVIQDELDGTANAIKKAANGLDDNFLVLSGDIIYKPEEIKDLARIPNSLLYTAHKERLYEYGTLELFEMMGYKGTYIHYINEKSTRPVSEYVNCGAYHFTPKVIEYIDKTPIDKRFNEKIITNTINLMIDDKILFQGIYIDRLNEISYLEDVKEVEDKL